MSWLSKSSITPALHSLSDLQKASLRSSSKDPDLEQKAERSSDWKRGAIRNLKKGFGFIAGDDGKDYFFHWTSVSKQFKDFRQLEIKERVSFRLEIAERGPRAVEVLAEARTAEVG